MLSGMWIGVTPIHGCQKGRLFKRDWIPCSKHDNHSRVNSLHNWRGGGYMTN